MLLLLATGQRCEHPTGCWMDGIVREAACWHSVFQVLAVDLLNPAPQAEARKHKLKVCGSLLFHFYCAKSATHSNPDSCSRSKVLLHGRQMSRLLHHHYSILPRSNCRRLCGLLDCSVSANRRESPTHRGMLVSKKVDKWGYLFHLIRFILGTFLASWRMELSFYRTLCPKPFQHYHKEI